jgi:AraC-like DNA-binding protein
VQVDLTPTGARRLFGVPAEDLTGHVVPLVDLLPGVACRLSERLAEARDWATRLDRVESLLAQRILGSRLDTAPVEHALARIDAAGGNLRISDLARELGVSRKRLIALFRDQVGVGPKLMARLIRFQGLMARARDGDALRWSELALDHGYYDQAHLVRDVRQFTGLTPTRARQEIAGLADLLV